MHKRMFGTAGLYYAQRQASTTFPLLSPTNQKRVLEDPGDCSPRSHQRAKTSVVEQVDDTARIIALVVEFKRSRGYKGHNLVPLIQHLPYT